MEGFAASPAASPEEDEGGDQFDFPFSYPGNSNLELRQQQHNKSQHHHYHPPPPQLTSKNSVAAEHRVGEASRQRQQNLGLTILNYGSSNESGQMLARELLARELQARELLAREMGSQNDQSQDHRMIRRSRSKSRRSSTGGLIGSRLYTSLDSCNASVDGSTMSRSRWEVDPAENFHHESSSLPAEFLYFKFERIVERWVDQKADSIMSLERRRPKLMNRPPRTITTIAKAIVSGKNNGVPRFLRNTTTTDQDSTLTSTAPLLASAKMTTLKLNTNTNDQVGTSLVPRKSSLSPVRNASTSRRSSPAKAGGIQVNNGKNLSRSGSPRFLNTRVGTPKSRQTLQQRSASYNKAGGASPLNRLSESPTTRQRTNTLVRSNRPPLTRDQSPTRKRGYQDKSKVPMVATKRDYPTKVKGVGVIVDTRSPRDTTEPSAESHYARREGPSQDSTTLPSPQTGSHQVDELELSPSTSSPLKPDPEGPTASTRPDPEGDRLSQQRNNATRARSKSPVSRNNSLSGRVSPSSHLRSASLRRYTPTSPEKRASSSHIHDKLWPQKPEALCNQQQRSLPRSLQPTHPSHQSRQSTEMEKLARRNPAQASPTGERKASNARYTGANKNVPASSEKIGSPTKTRAPAKSTFTPPPARKPATVRPSGIKPQKKPAQSPQPTTRRRKSRLPPLPSFRNNGSPSNEPTPPRNNGSPSTEPTPQRGPSSPREGPSTSSSPSPSKTTSAPTKPTSPRNTTKPKTPPEARKPTTAQLTGNSVKPTDIAKRIARYPNGESVEATPSHIITQSSKVKKADPPSPSPRSQGFQMRRVCRMHYKSAIRLQAYQRMLPHRRRLLQLRSAVIVLQAILRRTLQAKVFKQAKRGTRLQNFSCLVIQKNFRMASCRSSFIQLRHAVVIAQSAVRMLSCRSNYVELRNASEKLFGRKSIRSTPPTPVAHRVTVKGGRLRIYSALLLQSLVRMRWVRAAYLELRTSAKLLQKWSRKILSHRRARNRASVVLQKSARMLSLRRCFLDLRRSVIFMQKWTRMACVRSAYIAGKQKRLERDSAVLLQKLCRRDGCRSAYSQLRSSAITLQRWSRRRTETISDERSTKAAVVLQCWVRQKCSERFVLHTICAKVIQTSFRGHVAYISFHRQRTHASMIQAVVRGVIYRVRYILFRFAAIDIQRRVRGYRIRCKGASSRMYIVIGTTRRALSSTTRTPLDPEATSRDEVNDSLSDSMRKAISPRERRPDPSPRNGNVTELEGPGAICYPGSKPRNFQLNTLVNEFQGETQRQKSTVEDIHQGQVIESVGAGAHAAALSQPSSITIDAIEANVIPNGKNVSIYDDQSNEPRDGTRKPGRYGDVVSAALAFVAHSPSHYARKGKIQGPSSPVHSNERPPLPKSSSSKGTARSKSDKLHQGSIPNQATDISSAENPSSPEHRRRQPLPEHHRRQHHLRLQLRNLDLGEDKPDNLSTWLSTGDLRAKQLVALLDPVGANMSQLPQVTSALGELSKDGTSKEETTGFTSTNGNQSTAILPVASSEFTREDIPASSSVSSKYMPTGEDSRFDHGRSLSSVRLGTPTLPQGLPTSLVPAPPELVSRLSPVELSPSRQPLYFISSMSDESSGSPQLYALQPVNDIPPQQQPQTSYLYYMFNSTGSQLPLAPRLAESSQGYPVRSVDLVTWKGRKTSILEPLKRERKRKTGSNPDSIVAEKYPPIPSILENPSYYLPKKEMNSQGTKENNPATTGEDSYDVEENVVSSPRIPPSPRHATFHTSKETERTRRTNLDGTCTYLLRDYVTPINPLKQVLVQNWNDNREIMSPRLKKEDDCSHRAISEKLAAIKQKSRARKVQRWTQRIQKRNKGPPLQVGANGTETERDSLNLAVQQWANQTLRRRNILSVLTFGLDGDFATVIQSAWRSHRDQILLATSLLETWTVTCDFSPDTVSTDLMLRQTANILALDGAFSQVGYRWNIGKFLVDNGLVIVQWEGLVSVHFSDHGLAAEDTSCTVIVHCTACDTFLLDKWSEAKQRILLLKAAIEKNCDEQRQRLRRMLERSSTERSLTGHVPNAEIAGRGNNLHDEISRRYRAATLIQVAARNFLSRRLNDQSFLGVPDDFQQRMRVYSAVLIQSWYRMRVCRSMYQGLRRIQSTILVQTDRDDVETIRFNRYSEKHRCETIIEEGFECTTGSNETP
jgi:hypothetical protein